MKITKQNKKSNRKIIALLAIIGSLLVIAATVYLVFFKGTLLGWQPFGETSTTNPTTQNSDDTSHGTKDDVVPGSDKTTDQIPVDVTLVATIDQLSQSNGKITFKGSVNDNTADGNCSITFSNPNDRPISRTSKASQVNGIAVCGPIEIPETEFSFLGEWTATFRYYINDSQAVVERKVTIQ